MRKRVKNPHAVSMGRLGGLKGGPARAAKMTEKERSEAARAAALSRWGINAEDGKYGMEDDDLPNPCMHPEHNPPHLYIQAGRSYRHVCPGCWQTCIIRATNVRW